jgi:hypothetical protein
MDTPYETLIQLLDERDIGYSTRDDQSICTDLSGEVAVYRILARVDTDVELFQVMGRAPLRVPEGSRPAIAEALARANYGLRVGKFELDVDDGELRFHASQILAEDTVDKTVIDRLIGTTMAMLDRYLPAFLSVIYGNESPKDAVRCVEAECCGPTQTDDEAPETDG